MINNSAGFLRLESCVVNHVLLIRCLFDRINRIYMIDDSANFPSSS